MAALSINISVLSATAVPISAAASVTTSAEAGRAVAADQVVLAHEAPATDHTHKSLGVSPADSEDEQAAGEQAVAEQDAAQQDAAEQHAASHTNESAPAPTQAPAGNHQARAERAADAIPFDWRGHGVTFKVGCHPDQSRCAWGTFDHRVDEVWLSPAAFATDGRLRYVVAHEMAHAWQWSTNLDDRRADLTEFGVSINEGIEYGADCVAEAWGHPVATYWDCPSDAVAHMRSVLAAT